MTTNPDKGEVTAMYAHDHLADLLGRAEYGKERVVIRKHKKRVAALVPIEDLKLLEELEDRRDLEDFRAARAEWEREGRSSEPLDQVVRELGIKA